MSMDPKEFKRRLEELAEIQLTKVAGKAQRKPDETVTVWRNGQEIEIPEKDNHTLHYKIKKIKNETQKCVDCNRRVKNRTITKKLYSYPVNHWRRLCNNCNLIEHPETGKFCLLGAATQNVYIQYLRRTHPQLIEQNQTELTNENQPELAPVERKPAK